MALFNTYLCPCYRRLYDVYNFNSIYSELERVELEVTAKCTECYTILFINTVFLVGINVHDQWLS